MKREKFQLYEGFKERALIWSSGFSDCLFLNYNQSGIEYSGYPPFPSLLAAGTSASIQGNAGQNCFEQVKEFHSKHQAPIFGYFGYDLKNEIEELKSENPDFTLFPDMYFFTAEHLLLFEEEEVEISSADPSFIYEEINSINTKERRDPDTIDLQLKNRVSKEKYLQKVEKIKQHLIDGDIYELNLCMEFYAENMHIDPVLTFLHLSKISPAPFSAFMRQGDHYLLSSSPERFLKKEDTKLISQPIKGTAMRSQDTVVDTKIKEDLRNSEKERSENMMIVDLMRNDLAKSSVSGSIKVDELFGIYSFPQVHQMISTVSSTIRKDVHPIDAIRNAFPMGSMTGAPKIRAMELIDQYEESKRTLFSGAVGYMTPHGNFDFNVVIRSIFYNAASKYLSFQTGSAITYDSDPSKEYEECLLKGKAIRQALGLVVRSES